MLGEQRVKWDVLTRATVLVCANTWCLPVQVACAWYKARTIVSGTSMLNIVNLPCCFALSRQPHQLPQWPASNS